MCSKCAGNHDWRECKADEIKCANCVEAVEKLGLKIDVNHSSRSVSCPVYQRKLKLERLKVEY